MAANLGYAAVPTGKVEGIDSITQKPASMSWSQAKNATVVYFLSARCPCSSSHEDRIRELFTKFSGQGVQFIAVHSNQDEPETEAVEHFKKSPLPFPILKDPGASLANQFGAFKTPHAYLISPKGELLYQGGIDEAHVAQIAKKFYLETAIQQWIKGQKPDPSETRVLGCVIKR